MGALDHLKNFAADTLVVRAGSRAVCAYVVQSGELVVQRKQPKMSRPTELGPGDVFGETAIFSGRHDADLRTTTAAELVLVSADSVAEALGDASATASLFRALGRVAVDRARELRVARGIVQHHRVGHRILALFAARGCKTLAGAELAQALAVPSESIARAVEQCEALSSRHQVVSLVG